MEKSGYPDLHAHIAALEKAGLLIRVKRPINKDSEMHPLVRWQFRGGIPEAQRKAFLFENVVDSTGRHYDIPVTVGVLASNREIYSIGIGCPVDQIQEKWDHAEQNPITPVMVDNPRCHEIVVQGEGLKQPGKGVDSLPIPISTPGFDNAPYASCSMFISKDPETGLQNIGNYRAMVKSPTRLGMNPEVELNQGIYDHWLKYKARGEKMPVALVLGAPPAITFTSVHKLPKHMDELAVAGGLVGAPIRVCKAKTVDLIVPAEAFNIVLNVASLGIVTSWAMIILCQMQLRRWSLEGKLARPTFRLFGAPFTAYLTLVFLAAVLVLMAFDYPTGTFTVASLVVIIPLLVAGWYAQRSRILAIAQSREGYTGAHPVVAARPSLRSRRRPPRP